MTVFQRSPIKPTLALLEEGTPYSCVILDKYITIENHFLSIGLRNLAYHGKLELLKYLFEIICRDT